MPELPARGWGRGGERGPGADLPLPAALGRRPRLGRLPRAQRGWDAPRTLSAALGKSSDGFFKASPRAQK